jgi:hypothetical protein
MIPHVIKQKLELDLLDHFRPEYDYAAAAAAGSFPATTILIENTNFEMQMMRPGQWNQAEVEKHLQTKPAVVISYPREGVPRLQVLGRALGNVELSEEYGAMTDIVVADSTLVQGATILEIPISVTEYNLKEIELLVSVNGENTTSGAIFILYDDEGNVITSKSCYYVQIGWLGNPTYVKLGVSLAFVDNQDGPRTFTLTVQEWMMGNSGLGGNPAGILVYKNAAGEYIKKTYMYKYAERKGRLDETTFKVEIFAKSKEKAMEGNPGYYISAESILEGITTAIQNYIEDNWYGKFQDDNVEFVLIKSSESKTGADMIKKDEAIKTVAFDIILRHTNYRDTVYETAYGIYVESLVQV